MSKKQDNTINYKFRFSTNWHKFPIQIFLFLSLLPFNSIYAQDELKLNLEKLDFAFTSYNTGSAFSCISVDSNGNIWAGTSGKGLYLLNQKSSSKEFEILTNLGEINEFNILSVAGNKNGTVWVGHNGFLDRPFIKGGLEKIDINSLNLIKKYESDIDIKCRPYIEYDGLASRSIFDVSIDFQNTVWVAQGYDDIITSSDYFLTPGSISHKTQKSNKFISKGTWNGSLGDKELPYPAYTCNPEGTQTPQARSVMSITTDSTEVWAGVLRYTYLDENENEISLPNRILRYDLKGNYIPSGSAGPEGNLGLTFKDMGIPDGGIVNDIYRNNSKGTWVTTSFSGKGFSVYFNGTWTYMDPAIDSIQKIIPPNTRFNDNAIWGNNYGNVFMGTSNGLLVYDGRGPANYVSSYTLYSKTQIILGSPNLVFDPDMISNNIFGGCSEQNGTQWIATDNGIMRANIGFIKINPEIGICPTSWKNKSTLFCGDISTEQCLYSQELSKNKDVQYVENQIKTLKNTDPTYHCYETRLKLGNPNSPDGINPNYKYLTVENVFHILKEYAGYQAIIPYDLPEEVLGDDFLKEVKAEDVNLIKYIIDTTTEHISSVQSIMDSDPRLSEYDISDNDWLTAAGFNIFIAYEFIKLSSRKLYFQKQIKSNPFRSMHETQTYKLFNTPNNSFPRIVFKQTYNLIKDRFGCKGPGIEHPMYDPVIMHIDDNNYTISNYTKEGHYFHPGKLTRTVCKDPETGDIYIRFIGEGLHFCSEDFGKASANLNTIMGMILFKNVDIRLKSAIISAN